MTEVRTMTGTVLSAIDEIKALVVASYKDSRLAKSNLNSVAHRLNDLRASVEALTASASEPAPPCECMFPRDCNGSCELPRQATHTDDAHPIVVLADVLRCAEVWEPEVRIIGNVRAGDIVRAIRSWPTTASASPVPASEPEQVADGPNRYHLTEPSITIDGKTFGAGWLLISEEEYAALAKPVPTPDGAVEALRKCIAAMTAARKWFHDADEAKLLDEAIAQSSAALSHPADGWRDIESAPTGWGNFFFVRPCGMHHSGKPFLPTIVQFVDGEFYTPENELDPVYFGQNEPEDSPLKSTLEWFPIPQGWITAAPAANTEGE